MTSQRNSQLSTLLKHTHTQKKTLNFFIAIISQIYHIFSGLFLNVSYTGLSILMPVVTFHYCNFINILIFMKVSLQYSSFSNFSWWFFHIYSLIRTLNIILPSSEKQKLEFWVQVYLITLSCLGIEYVSHLVSSSSRSGFFYNFLQMSGRLNTFNNLFLVI